LWVIESFTGRLPAERVLGGIAFGRTSWLFTVPTAPASAPQRRMNGRSALPSPL